MSGICALRLLDNAPRTILNEGLQQARLKDPQICPEH